MNQLSCDDAHAHRGAAVIASSPTELTYVRD